MNPMAPPGPPRPVAQAPPKMTPGIIQAAPTVYTAPPAPRRADIKSQKQARMVKYKHTNVVQLNPCDSNGIE